MTDSPPPPPVIPGLTGLSVLARGGYATVYRAVQESIGREVAVKVENRTLDSEQDQSRFLREARAAGRMSGHPHVVDLFDVGVTVCQRPYLIMELCASSYAERIRRRPLTPVEARDVGVKIADALCDAHQLGVLHRDVKPANILISRFGEPTLADFGLAVLAEARDPSIMPEVLTPAYAAPEMFRHGAPSPAVDVYALCATLYTLMRGKPPRWREDRNPSLGTLLEIFTEPIPDLPGVPQAMLDLLRAGMANDPATRPTAARLRDLLTVLPLGPLPGAPVSGVPGSGAPVSGLPVSGIAVPGGPATDVPLWLDQLYQHQPPYHPWPSTQPPTLLPPPSPANGPPVTGQGGAPPEPDAPTNPPPDGTPTVPSGRRRWFLGWFTSGRGTSR